MIFRPTRNARPDAPDTAERAGTVSSSLPYAAAADAPSAAPSTPTPATRLERWASRLVEASFWNATPLRVAIAAIAAAVFVFIVTVPLDFRAQLTFAGITLATALALRNRPGRFVSLVMIILSSTTSIRYMYWRITQTLTWETPVDMLGGLLLFGAEFYAVIVLLLGYFQTAWPLERRPVPLPPDTRDWPSVDVFIPTYNEPLSVVKPTIFAAMALDYPRDKLRIHVLDDGRRADFKAFCERVGVTWTTRSDNRHAKAGNINEALKITDGEYVAVFDCDHVPTRSFLQISLGWFLKDPKLAMMQLPHHFFSADPFEKNLGTFRKVPNEGELFYGLVQDGNDLWNAAFFCGSCAVLRRAPTLEVGGIAIETVTEDAHTALKLHRLGYSTAYLSIPQAAGLATESLSGHIGQRIRWARGMAQIFRVDNPLLGKGLKIGQRLCYANAMLHFFYGLPRIVFLTAPLFFLFLNAHVIQASALMIAVFALPHIFHANVTNSRMQSAFRHSFWAEVYESVLAWYIMRPTLMALVNPKLGAFNVTAKGGRIEEDYFDWNISRPYLLMLGMNLIGFLIGCVRIFMGSTSEVNTTLLNLAWTLYNMLLLGASVAAASEARQVRDSHRVTMTLRAMLRLSTGRTIACRTIDYSEGGLGLRLPAAAQLPLQEAVTVSLYRGDEEFAFPALVAFSRDDRVGVHFHELSLEQEIDLVQCTFARADAWTDWSEGRKRDAPLRGLAHVLGAGFRGFYHLFRHVGRDIRRIRTGKIAPANANMDSGS
ncbi:UDP-forming cellulose synthase catalytic subunit [Robbsia sp. Bb-Pol-6]|uniref:Cellulose synthase catalytic subunit [UDP-forming] n=1 Tax=Robbsia betulipollinis TaxID=2981849 RepID=A0ABT3ZNM0_9BURK|nr:UDP-forming cellulose synthase catalytic subunit [Robbsia betulipollinis]MCY0387545.1 UDP-forming cellulose synthase catalytic subunit [Robbsia betulipollinis]